MIQFDRTQPIRHSGPRLNFGRGVYIVHVIGDQYARVTQSGVHVEYLLAQSIELENSIGAEIMKQRSYQQ